MTTTGTLPDFRRSPRSLSAAETASVLRKALRAAFPSTKFSVRSKTYSGGASIDVSYTDGPAFADVDAIAQGFAGGGFDGSIDLAYHNDSWLLPDGSASLAHTSGTSSSRSCVAPLTTDPPHPSAQLVRFGADYVFVSRSYSEPVMGAALASIMTEMGTSDPEQYGYCRRLDVRDGSAYEFAHRVLHARDLRGAR